MERGDRYGLPMLMMCCWLIWMNELEYCILFFFSVPLRLAFFFLCWNATRVWLHFLPVSGLFLFYIQIFFPDLVVLAVYSCSRNRVLRIGLSGLVLKFQGFYVEEKQRDLIYFVGYLVRQNISPGSEDLAENEVTGGFFMFSIFKRISCSWINWCLIFCCFFIWKLIKTVINNTMININAPPISI